MLCARERYFSAIEPAATRPRRWTVSRHCRESSGKGGQLRTNRFPSTAPPATTTRLDAVLLQIREIGMTRSWVEVHCAAAVVLRSLILIPHDHGNWRSKCDAKLSARLDLDSVFLVSWCGESALARTSTSHLRLNVRLGQSHAGRTAINDAANGAAMRLAIAGTVVRLGWGDWSDMVVHT
jgi:hypothetical protein